MKELNSVELMDYRDLLSEELRIRSRRNSAYSLRSFAKDLSLSNPYLSQILNRKKSLSEARGFEVATKLNWTSAKINFFLSLIRFQNAKDPQLKECIKSDLIQKYESFVKN